MTEFEERLSLMKQVRDSWANGGKVIVRAVASGKKGKRPIIYIVSCHVWILTLLNPKYSPPEFAL